jgi:acyl-CoA thioester hydrolase
VLLCLQRRSALPVAEMHEDPSKIVGVLLDAVVKRLDLLLVEEAEDMLLQLAAALAGDDLDEWCLLRYRLVDDRPQRTVDLAATVVDVVQVQLELHTLQSGTTGRLRLVSTWSAPVRYAEVDQQGVVFNAHYLTYCDEAMGAFCAQHDLLDISERIQLVKSTITWRCSARWGQTISVIVRCTRLGNSSLDVAFDLSADDEQCASVETTYVLTDLAGRSEQLPERVRLALS